DMEIRRRTLVVRQSADGGRVEHVVIVRFTWLYKWSSPLNTITPRGPTMYGRSCFIMAALLFVNPTSVAVEPIELSAQKYPNVVAVKVLPRAADTFDFDVTVSSPYDSPQRYADAFRVMSKE